MMPIGTQIRLWREARGWSQQQLADAIGTAQQSIARLENPRYTGHSIRMLRKIADALNVQLEVTFMETAA